MLQGEPSSASSSLREGQGENVAVSGSERQPPEVVSGTRDHGGTSLILPDCGDLGLEKGDTRL